jgi:hypothetical protein
MVSNRQRTVQLSVILIVLLATLANRAQTVSAEWQRVMSGNDTAVDINASSLIFQPGQIIAVQFRTRFSRPQILQNGSEKPKYRTRVDVFQFDVKNGLYRISKSELLDSSEKVVFSQASGDAKWKETRGATIEHFVSAMRQLEPFGLWKVVSYRYATGETASSDDPPELSTLVGSIVPFQLDRIAVGRQTCTRPLFEGRSVPNSEFEKNVGASLKTFGLDSEELNVIAVGCGAGNGAFGDEDFPARTLFIRKPDHRAVMLWSGVFLELEPYKPKGFSLPLTFE